MLYKRTRGVALTHVLPVAPMVLYFFLFVFFLQTYRGFAPYGKQKFLFSKCLLKRARLEKDGKYKKILIQFVKNKLKSIDNLKYNN